MEPANVPCPRRFLTVHQLVETHPCFTMGGIRHLIFHGKQNGFEHCLRRLGRRILIDEGALFEWLDKLSDSAINSKEQPRQVARVGRR